MIRRITFAALALLATAATAQSFPSGRGDSAQPSGRGPGTRAQAQVIMPTDPMGLKFQTENGFADAIVVGDTIYLSGVVAGPAATLADLPAAYDRAFKRIAAVLARAGASWDDVVDMSTFHTDLASQVAAFSTVKNRNVTAPFPAWTAIGISSLYEPSAVTEIKVVARKRTASR